MSPSFTIIELCNAPFDIFEKMINSIPVYERRLVLKTFQNNLKILEDRN